MRFLNVSTAAIGLAIFLGGCAGDQPHNYGQHRGDLSSLDERDGGLQSKDLMASTDLLARDLLGSPKLNHAREQWTIVVDRIENHTNDPRMDYNIFSRRLGTLLSKDSDGRVTLIENKARFHDIQNREFEGGGDNFGQGSGAHPGAAGIQPDFALVGIVQEMPNRGTSTYRLEFHVTDLHTRVVVWDNEYIVKVER